MIHPPRLRTELVAVWPQACVKAHQDSSHCRDIAVAYLQCRMDRDLMARCDCKGRHGLVPVARPTRATKKATLLFTCRQDLRELGLAPDTKADPAPTAPQH